MPEWTENITRPTLTPEQMEAFHRDGFVIVRGLFDAEETNTLTKIAKSDKTLNQHRYELDDGEGGKASIALWNTAGDDLYGVIARLPRIVDAMEALLGDEVYHYHSKMTIKDPFTGGAFAWHQDYGYWYHNGCLFPAMASVMVAVDPNTRENGCLQVLRGSQRMGRVEHGRFGDQAGANPELTEQAMKVLDLVYCEMAPGDALFFHCNVLHRSDQNKSPNPRWSLLCCYNTKHNNPYKTSHHPQYTPLTIVSDSIIKEMGMELALIQREEFLDPGNDKTIKEGAVGRMEALNG